MSKGFEELNPIMNFLFTYNIYLIKIIIVLIPSVLFLKEYNKNKKINKFQNWILNLSIIILMVVNIYNVVGFVCTL